ncbi:MAG: exopolysaccharide biosynthesis protein [Minisyncoccia bacterium]
MKKDTHIRKKLEKIIANLPPDKLTLAEIRDSLGRDGMLLLVILLTVVFLIPVSIPGVSTIFGGTILLIGVSILLGWDLWLPKSFLKKELPAKSLRKAFHTGLKWLVRLEKISKPNRLIWLTNGNIAHIINGLSIILAAILLMAPFGFIPFSNTVPAIALLFYSIGLLQKDGISIILGHIFNMLTIIYFTILISGGWIVILELIKYFNK